MLLPIFAFYLLHHVHTSKSMVTMVLEACTMFVFLLNMATSPSQLALCKCVTYHNDWTANEAFQATFVDYLHAQTAITCTNRYYIYKQLSHAQTAITSTNSYHMHKQLSHAQTAITCTKSYHMHKQLYMHKQLSHAQTAITCTNSYYMHKQRSHAQTAITCTNSYYI